MGGGTGSFAVLSGLRDSGHDISAIVNMVDNGGSSGILRDELGVLPPGDVRQCLVALSPEQEILRTLFTHRFTKGGLQGHTFGNLFLAGLEDMTGSFDRAVKTAARVLRIRGNVIPVTLEKVQLYAELNNGEILEGEHDITVAAHVQHIGLKRLYLEPEAQANPEAVQAIKQADLFVMAPGNLYSSLIPNILVNGIPDAIAQSRAKKVYIANLMTKQGQTEDFCVQDFVRELERWAGRTLFNTVVYNNNLPSKALLNKYKQEGSAVVFDPRGTKDKSVVYKGMPLLSASISLPSKSDPLALQRSLIRHDPARIAQALTEIIAA